MREQRRRGRASRKPLSKRSREAILKKTDGRCHICGGQVDEAWQADHIVAHGKGGHHAVENYLPAHPLCNNYRWHYLPKEFQYVLKIGVWARLQIEKGTPLGRGIALGFASYERSRERRRKTAAG
jgi:5-methylcytosine-specific restriction endonuclease McrA